MVLSVRAVEPQEYPLALGFWQTVFAEEPGYFERYYNGDPFYC